MYEIADISELNVIGIYNSNRKYYSESLFYNTFVN
jgi:hypothetical protein